MEKHPWSCACWSCTSQCYGHLCQCMPTLFTSGLLTTLVTVHQYTLIFTSRLTGHNFEKGNNFQWPLYRKYGTYKDSIKFWTITEALTLNTSLKSFSQYTPMNWPWSWTHWLNLSQDNPVHNDAPCSNYIWLQQSQKFRIFNIVNADIFRLYDSQLSIIVTLTFKTASQCFHKTPWAIMMHNHTKFGCKRSSSPEDTIQTKSSHNKRQIHRHCDSNIHPHFTLLPGNIK